MEADGSVYPCDFYMLDQYKLGNLNTDTLAQIDARRKEIGFIEQSCAVDEKVQDMQMVSTVPLEDAEEIETIIVISLVEIPHYPKSVFYERFVNMPGRNWAKCMKNMIRG